MIFLLFLRQLTTTYFIQKHSLRSRSSREIVTAFLFDWHLIGKKNLTALEFWRNVYVCGGCREEKISQTINSLWTSQR